MAEHDPFQLRHKFQDDIWGEIKLSDLERDVIDTPEFQRLFRTSQLGFVELVYQTANHTRGAHSIGACHVAKQLIKRLTDNLQALPKSVDATTEHNGLFANFEISRAESILITLGALLHDVSHIPLSHDLERKTHLIPYSTPLKMRSWYGHYDKHDDYETNPLLFVLICDHKKSVLARVLQHYSEPFWKQLQSDSKATGARHHHIKEFVGEVSAVKDDAWRPERHLLPELLFHLLYFEKYDESPDPSAMKIATTFDSENTTRLWHLGPETLSKADIERWHKLWYQPFRHDIIGNTLSADLIDYLARDPQRLGTKRRLDLHLLNYYVIVNHNFFSQTPAKPATYRCAIDLHDHKRGTTRTFLINDIFRLLDLRQEIHEKAVIHRVVQSANSMLARGLLLLGQAKRPTLKEVVGLSLEKGQCHSLQSEDLFFDQLLKRTKPSPSDAAIERGRLIDARRIFEKVIERRVCRPLMIIPGDWAAEKLPLPRSSGRERKGAEFPLRTLAAIVDSAYYSPFLLFVCSCVEKYLESVFDSDRELVEYAEGIISAKQSSGLITKATNQIPSRVIVWTVPFKQLYKDPAVVVALNGCVGQIDRVVTTAKLDDSTRIRLETGIRDADSKYATLWRLYVFISDGLYYTGILDKLLRHLPECYVVKDRHSHEERLEKAKLLISSAFEAISRNWSGLSTKPEHRNGLKKLLENKMDVNAFRGLVGRWIGSYRDILGRVEDLSTVDTTHYAHGFSLDSGLEEEHKRPCRDARYKYDEGAKELWEKAEKTVGSNEYEMVTFLKRCHLENPAMLSALEFNQLTELYANSDTRKRCADLLNEGEKTHNYTFVQKALKALWRSGFPWPADEVPSRSDLIYPTSETGIARWVRNETEILQNNVRRRISKELKSISHCLQQASRIHGTAVFDDFRLRVENEESLIWNDVREGRILDMLSRKWKLSPVSRSQAVLHQ